MLEARHQQVMKGHRRSHSYGHHKGKLEMYLLKLCRYNTGNVEVEQKTSTY